MTKKQIEICWQHRTLIESYLWDLSQSLSKNDEYKILFDIKKMRKSLNDIFNIVIRSTKAKVNHE
jgi:hypothetical protein